ncbi:MAG: hypothetical protein H6855_03390 [Rhodospirillales bacterium]|nr:hypothetical protein [Rhodospirillales bacterium]MCB9973582.1 hypothetical protein [Rhodospirillales bacterium]MCB9979614.1 hypothetical protein [Rhodospirillales bacterium]
MKRSLLLPLLLVLTPPFMSVPATVYAQPAPPSSATSPCKAADSACVTEYLETLAGRIEKESWRDQAYRELAKTLAADGQALKALPLIEKIQNPDTKALTIRGIGMEAAMAGKVPEELFTHLRQAAEKITDPPSYGIALTYIAMGQAFADDDDGAMATAADMKNDALRHKAYGETAEIQAEKGKFSLALESIRQIDSASFRNKAYKNVSRIFAERQKYQESFDMAVLIENPVMQAEAIQFMLDEQRRSREKTRD